MKTYKMSPEEIAKINNGKIKTYVILLVLLLVPVVFFNFLNGVLEQTIIYIIPILVLTVFSVSATGTHHFELDENKLSHFKRGKLKESFDLKQVRAISSIGQSQSTLIIKDDGDIKGDYHSELLGITTFNELLKDISAINDGTYQA